MSQTLVERAGSAKTKLGVVDCDVHHALRSSKDLMPFLSSQWQMHLETYGSRRPTPFSGTSPYFKAAPALSRKDSWPPNGGTPGSDLTFMQHQLLDRYGIEAGMLHLLSITGMDQRNQDFAAVLCRAINEWQVAEWTSKDKRLKAAIVVPGEDASAAIKEIEHWAGNRDFCQVALVTHTIEPMGRRRYWPIFEAAAANGLPIGLHSSGTNGRAIGPGGWASYYTEEHHSIAISQQALTSSLVCEGVFERIPALKVVIIEAGLAWVPSLCWRLDRQWARMRDEVPHVKRPPSEYIKEHMWFTTQPMDEPEDADDITAILSWIGWDRILFATDYPHWDFDDPETALKAKLTEQQRRMVLRDNAVSLYGLHQ